MFVGRDNIGELVKMWVVRVKIWGCYGCYYTEQRSNEQRTKNTLKKILKYVESIIIVFLALI